MRTSAQRETKLEIQTSAPKTKKKADARQRTGRLVLIAQTDEEEITLAWIRSLLANGYLQNLRSTAHAMTAHADTDTKSLIGVRRFTETIRMVEKDDEAEGVEGAGDEPLESEQKEKQ